ncbi:MULTISPECIES: tetratricopeptide repeat protein [unclassified Crossiella]|uniref:tetratricopeptide repeat protein n=1 Tax=unclassified Crossiella TaxID=2620835 RepID=UPI001FFEBDF3|nr:MULTISPECIES: tetratricopeptide repeat protein [unclassified Crossiella]MCK2242936.1 tetratricopeptide repeat protein [Crossiella sp. S99.2]MCK2256813.1 tetratricopeptide repeat protein [Crossiella sp. S99.1]
MPTVARLRRPRLDLVRGDALQARLTTVTAPAGYGKTTLLTAWANPAEDAWHTCRPADRAPLSFAAGLVAALRAVLPALDVDLPPLCVDGSEDAEPWADVLGALLCAAVADAVQTRPRGLLLLVDDVHLLDGGTAAIQLLHTLCGQAPPGLHLVLASRTPPPFPVHRLRGAGELVEVTWAELAFTSTEVADLLGGGAPGQADRIQELTCGWPVAVRLACATPDLPEPAAAREHPLFDYLAEEIVDREPPPVRALLRMAALFDRFTPGLLTALGVDEAEATLSGLLRRGLFAEPRRPSPGWSGLTPLARTFAQARLPVDPVLARAAQRRAADWYLEAGEPAAALAALAAAGEHQRSQALLAEHAATLLAHDGAGTVLTAVESVPEHARTPLTWRLAGDAHQVTGDWPQALDCLRRAAGPDGLPEPELASRMAWMHYFSGAPAQALAVCERHRPTGADPVSESALLSCQASAHWARGDHPACAQAAHQALTLARSSGDQAALGLAHTALAMVAAAAGDREANAEHYLAALAHAEAAGDVLGTIRIRVNRTSHFVEDGRYREALAEAAPALHLAEVTGFTTYRALGLNNRGLAHRGLGHLDEAVADFVAAQAIFARTGHVLTAAPLGHLGEVYHLRGDRALARAAYTEAITLSGSRGTVNQLVRAQVGLARLLLDEDPDQAETLLAQANAAGSRLSAVAVAVTEGQLALSRAKNPTSPHPTDAPPSARTTAPPAAAAAHLATARTAAHRAETLARAQRDRNGLAEALVLHAQATPDQAQARSLIDQAAAVWAEAADPIGGVRAQLARATLLGGAHGGQLAQRAERAARDLGAGGLAATAVAIAEQCLRPARGAVHIQTLGGFRVLLDGTPVPSAAWQSRKSRDLVKLLVTRRGQPITKDAVLAALWPGEPPGRLGNRFAVALSTARTVLDPHRRLGAGRCLLVEGDAVRLDTSRVTVDVLAFLADAAAGLTAHRQRRAEALPLLTTAEAAYLGDFLDEDVYADFAAELRDEARTVYLQVAILVAEAAFADGEHTQAARCCLRMLQYDRHAETAHLALVRALVAAGSHGEARRRYRSYVARMAEIEVEPRPFPA